MDFIYANSQLFDSDIQLCAAYGSDTTSYFWVSRLTTNHRRSLSYETSSIRENLLIKVSIEIYKMNFVWKEVIRWTQIYSNNYLIKDALVEAIHQP